MAVSDSDVDRELLNQIAEAYFTRPQRLTASSNHPNAGLTGRNAAPRCRRHWRAAFKFTPLVIL
jgi:hypothetical protein